MKYETIILCPYCSYESEECDFPDLFYEDLNNTKGLNEQYNKLQDLQVLGYNIVTCGNCGGVIIQYTGRESNEPNTTNQ